MSDKPFVKNAADEHQVREAEKRSKRIEDRDIEDVSWVLSTKQGRRFYWRLMQKSGLDRISLVPSQQETGFREGERNVALRLKALAKQAGLETYQLMEKESEEYGNA